jgi:cell division protein FtsL
MITSKKNMRLEAKMKTAMMVISVTYLYLQATKFLIRQDANTLQYRIKTLHCLN